MSRLFLTFLFLLLLSSLVWGAEIRVATTGTDDGTCGANGDECRTVGYAVENRAAAGDTVLLEDGTWTDAHQEPASADSVIEINDASFVDWVTVKAENEHLAIIDGSDALTCMDIRTCVKIRFEDIVFQDPMLNWYQGSTAREKQRIVSILASSTDIYFYNCKFLRSGASMIYTSPTVARITIDKCLLAWAGLGSQRNPQGPKCPHEHLWYARGADLLLQNSVLYGTPIGYHIKIDDTSAAITNYGMKIVNNTFGSPGAEGCAEAEAEHGITFPALYDVCCDTQPSLTYIRVLANDGGNGWKTDLIFANNVYWSSATDTHDAAIRIASSSLTGAAPIIIQNEKTNATHLVRNSTNNETDNTVGADVTTGGGTWGAGADVNQWNVGLNLTDPDNQDFSLTAQAAVVINMASATYAPAEDYLGITRPVDGADDVGAYEYTGVVTDPPTMKAHWKLDTGALTTDSSGEGNTLTNSGVGEGVGKIDVCGDWEAGDPDYMTITDDDWCSGCPLKFGESYTDFSFTLWFKAESVPGDAFPDYLFSKYDIGGDQRTFALMITVAGENNLQFNKSDSDLACGNANQGFEALIHSNGVIAPGVWYFVALVFDDNPFTGASTARMYLFDDNAGTWRTVGANNYEESAGFNEIAVCDCDLFLGRDHAGTAERYFDGLMDDIRYYNYKLTEEEIETIKAATSPTTPAYSNPGGSSATATGSHTVTLDASTVPYFTNCSGSDTPYFTVALDYGASVTYYYTGRSGLTTNWTATHVAGNGQDVVVFSAITLPGSCEMEDIENTGWDTDITGLTPSWTISVPNAYNWALDTGGQGIAITGGSIE